MSRKFRPTSLGSQSGIYSVRGSELARTGKTSSNQIRCVVELLDDSEFFIDIDKQSKGEILLEAVFKHLNLLEKHFFGLQFVADTPDNLVSCLTSAKILHQVMETSVTWNRSLRWLNTVFARSTVLCGPPYIFYFRVRFFASDPSKLSEDITRYFMWISLFDNVCTIHLVRLPCLYDTAAELASYVLQGELGDYDSRVMVDSYVSEFRFVPDQTEDFEERTAEFHKHHGGQSPADAEFNFLEVAKNLDLYGVDLHFAKDHDGLDLHIGISPLGLTVYHNRCKINFFPWSKIVKVCFKRKRFFVQIRPDWNEWTDNVIGFHMPTYRACKTLWKTCVEYHTFYRTHFPKPSLNRRNSLVRIGSKYRYRGKTEYQALEEGRQQPRIEPRIVRTLSRRYSKRNEDGSRRKIDLDNIFNKDDSEIFDRGPQSAGLNYSSSVPSDFDKINQSLIRSKSLGMADTAHMNRLKPALTPELQRNGSVHKEGVMTVRLEPDEQGRFGFNVQVRNLPVSFSSKCRHLWNVCDNGSKLSSYRTQTTFFCLFLFSFQNLESGDLLVYFQELYRKKPGMSMEEARKPQNLPRNRYRDILPYDDTRVKLIKGKNDYVNANYVTMEIPARGVTNRYIAAQGPLEKTCGDFWQVTPPRLKPIFLLPDVPDDSTDFLEFIHIVRHYREGTKTPSVLHCSAGVGRTGVFIFMETVFNMIEGAEPIFPLEVVRRMRDQRCSLIQTPGQFIFVLEALLRAYEEEMVKPL
ncbi:PREDICTED: tyrosine-protein phosphatase non-receptor type 4-like [Acropora digitifera]|uniref:tyrosine-protein phosphatase non-receptor type 4-like n=1 Tax=Acropora digitifera TaxID=70779 RepID=UPI00077A126E|nr:PREDICTED: tyrosine-protein phosphatase non-receptor type 4-like [Acropora digitifera]